MIRMTATTILETSFGTFDFFVYQDDAGKDHMVLKKKWKGIPLVRIHSECATGDLFSSVFCDCEKQLHKALEMIQKQGGLLLYLRQEGRGLGLTEKIKAYELQRKGLDTVEANQQLGRKADERSYGLAIQILRDEHISALKLLTNNPEKIKALEEAGLNVRRESFQIAAKTIRGKRYLQTKKLKLGHLMD